MNRSQNHDATPKTPSSKRRGEGGKVFPGGPATATGGFPRSAILVHAIVLALAPLRALAEAPAAPANLRAVFEAGEIYIYWDHPGDPDISGYDWRFRFAKVDIWTPDWTFLPTPDADTVSVGLGTRYGDDRERPENAFDRSRATGTARGPAWTWCPGMTTRARFDCHPVTGPDRFHEASRSRTRTRLRPQDSEQVCLV